MRKFFTLIELIIVIVVLGILAAIVIPNISSMKDKSTQTAIQSNIKSVQTAVDQYKLDNEELPVKGELLEADFDKLVPEYLRDKPKYGHYYLDDNQTVFGTTFSGDELNGLQLSIDTNAKVSWEPIDGAISYRIYERASDSKSTASNYKLFFVTDEYEVDEDGKYFYQGEVGKEYYVTIKDKYSNLTPPIRAGKVEEVSKFTFTRISNGYKITGLSTEYSDLKDIQIPKSYKGDPVYEIEQEAFKGKGITSIVIPDTIKSIGSGAFANNKLTEVYIPSSVTKLGENPFYGNPDLTVVTVDEENPKYTNYTEADSIYTKDFLKLITGTKNMSTYVDSEGDLVYVINSNTEVTGASAYRGLNLGNSSNPTLVSTKIVESNAYADNNFSLIVVPPIVEEIHESTFNGNQNPLTIIGQEGTYAEEFANSKGYIFKPSL